MKTVTPTKEPRFALGWPCDVGFWEQGPINNHPALFKKQSIILVTVREHSLIHSHSLLFHHTVSNHNAFHYRPDFLGGCGQRSCSQLLKLSQLCGIYFPIDASYLSIE